MKVSFKSHDGLSGDFPARSLARGGAFFLGDDVARLNGGVSADFAGGFHELRHADHRGGNGIGCVEKDERTVLAVGGGELVDALADLLHRRCLREGSVGGRRCEIEDFRGV